MCARPSFSFCGDRSAAAAFNSSSSRRGGAAGSPLLGLFAPSVRQIWVVPIADPWHSLKMSCIASPSLAFWAASAAGQRLHARGQPYTLCGGWLAKKSLC